MMKLKTTAICAALLAAAISVHAQGTVIFANSAATAITNIGGAKITSTTPVFIGLYYNTDTTAAGASSLASDNWTLNDPTVRNGPIAGIFNGGTRTLAGTGAQSVLLQVRVWNNAFANWNAAAGAGGGVYGLSKVMTVTLATGSTPPPSIIGDGGFAGITLVPEPSILALGLLGTVGTLVLFRRRR